MPVPWMGRKMVRGRLDRGLFGEICFAVVACFLCADWVDPLLKVSGQLVLCAV